MAGNASQEGLKPSMLDRLIDPESEGTSWRRGYSVDQMIDAVRGDLEELLNSHRMAVGISEELVEVRRSIVAYGMPDLSTYESAGPETARRVGAAIEEAIALFEPRLTDVQVIPLKGDASKTLKMDFAIRAMLRLDPSPEVAFVTLLKLTTGETTIERAVGVRSMSETLYPYYERELTFIRQFAQEFARLYPATAGRLLLEANRSTDPHVERMIESFALLTGRIQHRIDDDFPELTTALLGVLYPHYLAPIPSMAIVQFDLDAERARSPEGFLIARDSRMSTRPVGDLSCRYRTGYPVRLWPVRIADAKLIRPPFPRGLTPPRGSVAALRIQLELEGGRKFAELSLDRLRFYLKGESETVALLYELLFNHALGIVLRDPSGAANRPPVNLRPAEGLAQVGFEREDGLLPYPPQSFVGYRLLSEFFAFPYKFHFVDLCGLGRACRAGYEKQLEVVIFVNRTWPKLEQDVTADTFRLGCTPLINLFEQTAEPIPLTGARYEYRIVPDVAYPDGMEVYSVDQVTSVDPIANETTEYLPFYSLRHGTSLEGTRHFWYAGRRPSTRPNDRGSEVYLSLVDLDFDPARPSDPTLVVRTTCTNRELPAVLQQAGERLVFDLEAAAPLSRIRCVQSPSLPLRPPVRRGSYWRLISHLCLNHLSLADSTEGLESLREILRLYDVSDASGDKQRAMVARQLIEGITAVSSRRVTGRLSGAGLTSFCRGMEVTIEFDEQKYVGSGVLLFASVLERFLALYTTINSFTQLVARTTQGEGPLKTWPPRAGDHTLI